MASRTRALIVIRSAADVGVEPILQRYGSEAEVIFDRRRRERRTTAQPPIAVERRGQVRRRPLRTVERVLWDIAGYQLVSGSQDQDHAMFRAVGSGPPGETRRPRRRA